MLRCWEWWYRPQPAPHKAVLLPLGPVFVNGLSRGYATDLPPHFAQSIDQKSFLRVMEDLNETLAAYWPCAFCWYLGILLALFTCGLGLCLPYCCVRQAEEVFTGHMERLNLQTLRRRGLMLKLVKRPFYSWMELHRLADEPASSETQSVVVRE